MIDFELFIVKEFVPTKEIDVPQFQKIEINKIGLVEITFTKPIFPPIDIAKINKDILDVGFV